MLMDSGEKVEPGVVFFKLKGSVGWFGVVRWEANWTPGGRMISLIVSVLGRSCASMLVRWVVLRWTSNVLNPGFVVRIGKLLVGS